MSDPTILAMAGSEGWLARLQFSLGAVRSVRIIVTQSMSEASELLPSALVDLIVVDWLAPAATYDQMDELLWANSTLPHPAPVLVTSETYEPEQASTLFQMGVDEYIDFAEQREKLPWVLCQLLTRSSDIEQRAASSWRLAPGRRHPMLPARSIRAATPA
jgi:DNA-binding NarL/FixJ family response regulator